MIGRSDLGRIVWLDVPDPQGGNPKRRPCLILDITRDGTLVANVATTSRFDPDALADDEILLPSGAPGRPSRLGLDRPTVAKCSWLVVAPADMATPEGPPVPRSQQVRIMERVQEMQSAGRCTAVHLSGSDN